MLKRISAVVIMVLLVACGDKADKGDNRGQATVFK